MKVTTNLFKPNLEISLAPLNGSYNGRLRTALQMLDIDKPQR